MSLTRDHSDSHVARTVRTGTFRTPPLFTAFRILSRARYQPGGHVTSLLGGGAVWKEKETESAT